MTSSHTDSPDRLRSMALIRLILNPETQKPEAFEIVDMLLLPPSVVNQIMACGDRVSKDWPHVSIRIVSPWEHHVKEFKLRELGYDDSLFVMG